MSIQKTDWGHTAAGVAVQRYTLSNTAGVSVSIINFGGRITELHVPGRSGKAANVVLGYDNLGQYLTDKPYLGALIGRTSNRIANGRFLLDGKSYQLAQNNSPHNLHGGPGGFDKVVWGAAPVGTSGLRLTYASRDGEEGFPGNVAAEVIYTLSDPGDLRIDYHATTDRPTPIDMTNHSYFNLAGAGTILGHELAIYAEHYTPVDKTLIPTGEILPVADTPFDFTTPQTVGRRIDEVGLGYDHNYVLNARGGRLARAAILRDPVSGRSLELETTQVGVQLYTGNFLDATMSGIGGPFEKHGALCLETQHFPDSVNKPQFPSVILRPGQEYRQTTVFRFRW